MCNQLGSSDILPAKAFPVALYLESLLQSAKTPAPVISAFYGIKWMHDLYGLDSPTDSKIVVNVVESAKRILSTQTNKKEPITVEILLAMYKRIYKDKDVMSQRIIVASLLGYAGFMRSAELLQLQVSDIVFEDTYILVFVESSKTDKYRDGSWIPIAKSGTVLCPYTNLQKYIEWANLKGDDYIFCNLSKTKTGFKPRKVMKAMSYTSLREQFIKAFQPHVSDISSFGLHSLRSGGATSAANSGVRDRLFKRHGRWTSESAKDGYVKDDMNSRLIVSKSLGL